MAVIFPKSSDIILKVAGAVVGVGAVIAIAAFTYYTYPTVIDTGYQPVQPVPTATSCTPASLGWTVIYCHSTVYKAAFAAVPATETCMNCHTQVKTQSPLLRTRARELRDRQADPVGENSPPSRLRLF